MIVPTPIGNLEDITLRALRALREADLIACEDTRRTLALLSRYNIRKPLLSFHEHNESRRTQELVGRLEEGTHVVLVSDAGTPGISDPGATLLKACIDRGIEPDVLPGPSAFVPALVLSGFCLDTFSFHGFLPRKGPPRREALLCMAESSGTIALYASPHRLAKDLEDLSGVLGNREAVLARELTKLHQETLRGTLSELAVEIGENPRKGEFVVVIAPVRVERKNLEEKQGWKRIARILRGQGYPVSEVVKVVKEGYGIPKNTIKKWLLGSEGPGEGDRNAAK